MSLIVSNCCVATCEMINKVKGKVCSAKSVWWKMARRIRSAGSHDLTSPNFAYRSPSNTTLKNLKKTCISVTEKRRGEEDEEQNSSQCYAHRSLYIIVSRSRKKREAPFRLELSSIWIRAVYVQKT